MTKHAPVSLLALAMVTAGTARAADVSVTATKLIVIDKLTAASKAKTVFVAKDPGATKGTGTDVNGIEVRFDFAYDSATGSFTLPPGASDGTSGWLVNKDAVAKYVNKDAPSGPTGAKVGVIKPDKLLKLVGKTLGDEPIDLIGNGAPLGSVFTAYAVTNGLDVNVHCSEFAPGSCSFKEIAGGTGRKLACKSGVGDPVCSAAQTVPGDGSVSFATYNVGLAQNFVALVDERAPEVAAAVAASDHDVLCLQEVFRDDDLTNIVSAASSAYPFSYFELTDDPTVGGAPACTEADVQDLLDCVALNGCDTDPGGLINCTLANCSTELTDVSVNAPDCFNCLVANSGLPLDLLTQVCLEGGGTLRDGGRNGVVLLSKRPLVNTGFITMDAFAVQRVVLHAQQLDEDLGAIDLYCTHFTAELSGVPYGGNFDDYEAEQAQQVVDLLDFISTSATSGQVIALGDFNTGPEIQPDIVAELPLNYDALVTGGLTSPYANQAGAQCTFCSSNTLNDITTPDVLIDHAFFSGMPGGSLFSGTRLFESPVSVDPGTGPVSTNLSDHYGVDVTVTLP